MDWVVFEGVFVEMAVEPNPSGLKLGMVFGVFYGCFLCPFG